MITDWIWIQTHAVPITFSVLAFLVSFSWVTRVAFSCWLADLHFFLHTGVFYASDAVAIFASQMRHHSRKHTEWSLAADELGGNAQRTIPVHGLLR